MSGSYVLLGAVASAFVVLCLYIVYRQKANEAGFLSVWPLDSGSTPTLEPEDARWAEWGRRGLNDSNW